MHQELCSHFFDINVLQLTVKERHIYIYVTWRKRLRANEPFTFLVRNALILLKYIFEKNFIQRDTTVAAFD